MKRIGVDAHVLTGKFQGSRTYLLNILRQVGRIDTTNHYLIYSFDPAVTRVLLPFDNFEHLRLAMHAPVPRLLFYWPWEQWRRRLDLLLTQYISPLLYSGRQIVIVHDLLFETHPQYFTRLSGLRFRTLVRLSATRARAVLALSQTTRREIVSRYRIAEQRVHLVSGGIDPEQHGVDPARAPPFTLMPYVLAVGRLEPRKNIGTLLRAFRLMRMPGVQLVVIGKEDFRAADIAVALRAMQGEAGVTWLTEVSDADLPYYYRHAAVFAFPTFAEGFGLPVLEALAHGIPVVTSDHPALREAGGTLADYFPADAADADRLLAALLDRAIADGPRWSAADRDAHLAKHSWVRSAHAMVAAINGTHSPATSRAEA